MNQNGGSQPIGYNLVQRDQVAPRGGVATAWSDNQMQEPTVIPMFGHNSPQGANVRPRISRPFFDAPGVRLPGRSRCPVLSLHFNGCFQTHQGPSNPCLHVKDMEEARGNLSSTLVYKQSDHAQMVRNLHVPPAHPGVIRMLSNAPRILLSTTETPLGKDRSRTL